MEKYIVPTWWDEKVHKAAHRISIMESGSGIKTRSYNQAKFGLERMIRLLKPLANKDRPRDAV